jgi:hypothetical protein
MVLEISVWPLREGLVHMIAFKSDYFNVSFYHRLGVRLSLKDIEFMNALG